MASAPPVSSSIDHSSSDHSDRVIPWSQIVRGEQKQPHQEKTYFQECHNEELDVDVDEAVDPEFMPCFGSCCSSSVSWVPVASSSEARSPSPSSSSCADANVDTSYGLLAKDLDIVGMDEQINAKDSRPAWKKVPTSVGDGTDPSPVGAMSWPALSAVRFTTKSAPPVMEMAVTQGLPFRVETGNSLASPQKKPPVSHVQYRNGSSSSHENVSDMPSGGWGSDYIHQSAKGLPFPADAAVNGLGSQQRAGIGPTHFPSNTGHRRPVMRDYGKGIYGRNSVGRSNAYSRNGGIQLQRQKIGTRNMQLPSTPFIGPNMGFMPLTGFQNPYGAIYYMPTPPDSYFGAMYYGVPGYYTPALESMSLEQELLKQIEYYFSVENLCKDIYLRSHMDSEGFVPIGVIASFNRVRRLSQNLTFILDVLRESMVVEVQGEGIRKRDGWMQWLPQPSWQRRTNSSAQADDTRKEFMMGSVQDEDSPGIFSRALNELQITETFPEKSHSQTSSAMDDVVDAYANSISSLNPSKSTSRTFEELGRQTTTKCFQFGKEQPLSQTELNGILPRFLPRPL